MGDRCRCLMCRCYWMIWPLYLSRNPLFSVPASGLIHSGQDSWSCCYVCSGLGGKSLVPY